MSVKLFVGNLSFDTTYAQLRDLFSEIGIVDSCILILDRDTEQSKGYGFVEMNSLQAANAAIERFNGQDLNGRVLHVDEARAKESRIDDDAYGECRAYDFSGDWA